MKDLFQSKSVPRGTRTIWRYLSALFILFTFAIGNVWAADYTIYEATSSGVNTSNVDKTEINVTFNTMKAASNSVTTVASDEYGIAAGLKAPKWGGSGNGKNIAITVKEGYIATITAYVQVNTANQTVTIKESEETGTTIHTVSCAAIETVYEVKKADLAAGTYYIKASDKVGLIKLLATVTSAGDDPEPEDTTAPTLASSVPADGATDVAVEGTIVLTFSEAIASVDGTKFTLTGATKGTVAINSTNSKQVNVPYSGAANEAIVTLSVAAEAVADAAGNKSAALSNISFTTVAAAPAPVAPDVVLNNNGTLNSTDFVTLVSELDGDDYSVSSVAYTNNFKFGNTCSSVVNQSWSNKYLAYDVKTTSATLKLYVYNKNSNSKNLYYQVLSETGNGDFKTESITSKGDGKIIEIPVTATKGTRVVFGASSTDVRICQLEVYENGTTLTKAGEVGYELALKGRPFATGSSNLFSGNIDGMEYVLYSELKLVNNNAYSVMRNNDGTHYFKIPATNDVQLKVTTNNSAKFYVLGSAVAGDPDKDVQYGGEAGTFNVNLPHKDGYWYIIPVVAATGTGSEVRISKIAFATLPAGKHVTYSAGEGSVKEGKSLPTHADAWEGDKITLASGDNLERSGYDFSGWKANGTGDLLLAGSEYTMGNAAVQFVAQWQLHVAKYGVKFMDGEEKLDSLSVTLGQAPSFADPKKALHTFTGWRDGGDNDVTLSDLATSVTVEDTKLVLYAKWAKAYAADGTVNFADDNNSGALADFLPAGYACGNLDGSKNSVWGKESEGDAYFGYKLRHSGAYVELRVVANKRVTFTFGNYAQAGTIKVGEAAAETCTLTDSKYVVDTDAEAVIRFTTTSDGTVTLKSIIIGEIPAQSDDASLSDLTLKYGTAEAATISGFASTKQIYYVEAPYGTAKADLPIVGATATDATNALVTINQAKDREDWKTVIRVQAEDRIEAHDMYYEVRFKVQPKLGVEIIKAVTTTANDGDATGYIGGTYKNTKTGNAVKLDKNHHFGLVIAANNAFQEGDIFAMNITAAAGGNMGTMKIYESTDATEPLFESTEIGTVGMNYWTLPASVNGKTSLYIKRGGGDDWNPTFSSIAVYRLMAPFIESFEIEGVGELNIEGTNITASVANTFDVTALTPTVKYWGNGGGAIDKTGAQDFTDPVQYTVSSAYAEDATGDYAPVIYTVTINKVAPSVEPTITTQPQGANYVEGATIAALTVVAESAEGELSYQWQVKNGNNYEDIEGANAASYTPAVSAIGSYTYRVVVTNTEDSKPATSVNSNDATVEITSDPACATFVTIPAESPYRYVNSGEWTLFNANSSGRRDDGNTFVNNAKDYENNTVNGFAKQRCAIIFDKDMKQVRFYTNNTSTGRNWASSNPVQVSADADKFLGIEEGNPSYTVYAASTSMEKYAESDYKIILKADGEFVAGKVYLFSFSNSVTIFKICAVEADPKAEAPVFSGTLSDEAICPGSSFATLDATASPVTSYAWYKDDEVIENAEAATYTPTEAGTYYCIATNSSEGYRDNSTKSAEAVLSVNVTTAITAHADAIGDVGAEKAVSVTAEGTNLSYQWQACDENGVVTDATVLGTTASMNVTIAAETKYYLATVTGACGVETQVVVVEEWHEVAQADVTESTTWDWTKSCWDGHENVVLANTGVEELMANVNNTVVNNSEFRSDMLVVRGQYAWRNEGGKKYFQGYSVKFHTTVPGLVKVTYRGTGNSKNVILSIGDYTAPEYAGDYTTVQAFVPAGDVVINGIGGEGNENGMVRIKEIVFHAPDYTRNVSNNIGTLCVDHNVPAGYYMGATFYQIAGRNATYPDKLDFDQVAPDEELKAGEPYIFQSTTGRIDLFYGETEKTEPVVVNGMHGLLANGHLDITNDNKLDILYISDNKLHNCSNLLESGLTLVANRAYIVMSEVDASENLAPGRTRMTIGGSGAPQIATGVDNLNESETPVKVLINGQIFILRGEKMYDATGRLVK